MAISGIEAAPKSSRYPSDNSIRPFAAAERPVIHREYIHMVHDVERLQGNRIPLYVTNAPIPHIEVTLQGGVFISEPLLNILSDEEVVSVLRYKLSPALHQVDNMKYAQKCGRVSGALAGLGFTFLTQDRKGETTSRREFLIHGLSAGSGAVIGQSAATLLTQDKYKTEAEAIAPDASDPNLQKAADAVARWQQQHPAIDCEQEERKYAGRIIEFLAEKQRSHER